MAVEVAERAGDEDEGPDGKGVGGGEPGGLAAATAAAAAATTAASGGGEEGLGDDVGGDEGHGEGGLGEELGGAEEEDEGVGPPGGEGEVERRAMRHGGREYRSGSWESFYWKRREAFGRWWVMRRFLYLGSSRVYSKAESPSVFRNRSSNKIKGKLNNAIHPSYTVRDHHHHHHHIFISTSTTPVLTVQHSTYLTYPFFPNTLSICKPSSTHLILILPTPSPSPSPRTRFFFACTYIQRHLQRHYFPLRKAVPLSCPVQATAAPMTHYARLDPPPTARRPQRNTRQSDRQRLPRQLEGRKEGRGRKGKP